ncbi:MAG: hypothetical protein HQL12_07700 [Candidatus Omnitrophica bacterium]|nr:hypothetical protein [Candidatus Omnitrophota bacterium]
MQRRISLKAVIKRPVFIFFIGFLFLEADISYAAGIIMRVQQMKAQKQRPQMTQEQYQEYQQRQGGGQPQGPVKKTYQQEVDERNQAIAEAILKAHNPSVSSETHPAGNNPAASQAQKETPGPGMLPAGSSSIKDVVDLSEVWKKLDNKSAVWTLLIDDQAKLLTISEYIDRFHKQGVKINAPPLHYAQMIDQMAEANPQMLQRPFGELLQILAIVDYDFDNGMNKDDLARKVLGEAGFEQNKKRFGQK